MSTKALRITTVSKSLWSDAWARLVKNKGSVISAVFITVVCVMSLMADLIAPYSFRDQNMERILFGPNAINWLGTDSLGRDLLSRIIYGTRMSIAATFLPSSFRRM